MSHQQQEPSRRQELIQFLQSQVHHYDALTRDHLTRIEQFMVAGFTVAGIAAPLLLIYKQYAVAAVIPAAGLFLTLFAINTAGELMALAAYRCAFEESLERLLIEAGIANGCSMPTAPWD